MIPFGNSLGGESAGRKGAVRRHHQGVGAGTVGPDEAIDHQVLAVMREAPQRPRANWLLRRRIAGVRAAPGAPDIIGPPGTALVTDRCPVEGEFLDHGVAGPADGGHAAVGDIVLFHVQEAQRRQGRRAQAEAHERRDPPAIVLHAGAARLPARLAHDGDATGDRVAELVIDIDGHSILALVAERQRCARRVAEFRVPADKVDRPRRRSVAVVGAGRPLLHVDLRDVEHVVRDRSEVAEGVDENARGGIRSGLAGSDASIRIKIVKPCQ